MRREANDIKRELRNRRTEKIRAAKDAIKSNPEYVDALIETFALWKLNEIEAIYTTTEEQNYKKGLLAFARMFDYLSRSEHKISSDLEHIQNAEVPFEVLEKVKGWTWSYCEKQTPYNNPFPSWKFVFCKDNKPIAGFDSEEEMHAFCQYLTTTTEGIEKTEGWCKANKEETRRYPVGVFFPRKEYGTRWHVYKMVATGYAYPMPQLTTFPGSQEQCKRICDFLNKEHSKQ